jgi:hypothetical protein
MRINGRWPVHVKSNLSFASMAELYTVAYSDLPEDPGNQQHMLSLFISPSAVQFLITEDQNTVAGLADIILPQVHSEEIHADAVGHILNDYRLLNTRFKTVHIAVLNRAFTLMPESFHDGDHAAEMLSFSSGATVINCMSEKIGGIGFCYSIGKDLLSFCERSFPGANIRHAGLVTLAAFLNNSAFAETNIFINLHRSFFELACRQEKQLALYNVFHYETDEDALYFILFTLEQLGMNPQFAKVTIAAEVPVTQNIIVQIKKYIRHVNFIVRDRSLVMKRGSSLPSHYYFTLLHHHLCGL